MPTQVLYMEDRRGQEPDPCYLREFDATVLERGPDFVVLDRTAFYAEGGGQPYDTGSLSWSGGVAKVLRVTKEKGVIRHHVDRLPREGAVRVVVDSKIGDRSLLDLIPASIRRLRVIQVGTEDYCPCGGTHLRNTSEIGRVHVVEKRSKGKETDRITYELLPK